MKPGYLKIIISIILACIIIFITALYNIGKGLGYTIGNIPNPERKNYKTDNRFLYTLIIPVILAFSGIYDLIKN